MNNLEKFKSGQNSPLRILPDEEFTCRIALPPTKSVLKKCPACNFSKFMSPKDDENKFICLYCDVAWTEKVEGEKLFVIMSGVKNSRMRPEILGVEWSPL